MTTSKITSSMDSGQYLYEIVNSLWKITHGFLLYHLYFNLLLVVAFYIWQISDHKIRISLQ